MMLNHDALQVAYAAAPPEKRDMNLIATVIRAYVNADTNPQRPAADSEDSSREDEHDCGEDVCVCRQ